MLDLRPLKTSTFRHLAAAYWVNEFGNWIGDVALALLVYDRTGSPLATAGLFLALRFAPALIAQLLAARSEAFAPGRVLPLVYLGEAVIFAVIAVVSHHFSLPAVLVLSAVDGALAVTAKALTRSAGATHLVEHSLLREGNAVLNLGAMVSSAIGPALAGIVVAWRGPFTALMLDAVTFVVTAVIVATAHGIRIETDPDSDSKGRLRAGIAVLRDQQAVRILMLAVAATMLLGSIVVPVEVVLVKHTLHGGDAGYGALLGAWGVGMVIGGAVFAVASRARIAVVLLISAVAVVIGYAGMAASPTLLVACLFAAVGGIGNGSGWIGAVTAIQQSIPMRTQTSVMAVLEGVNQLMPAVGFIVGGAITALSSPRVAFAVSAGGLALVVLFCVVRPVGSLEITQAATNVD